MNLTKQHYTKTIEGASGAPLVTAVIDMQTNREVCRCKDWRDADRIIEALERTE